MYSRFIPKGKNLLLIDTQIRPLHKTINFHEYILLNTYMVPISHRKKYNDVEILSDLKKRDVDLDVSNPLFNIGAVVIKD